MTDKIPLRYLPDEEVVPAVGEMRAGETVGIAHGGTGADDATEARVNLGISETPGSASTFNYILKLPPTSSVAAGEVSRNHADPTQVTKLYFAHLDADGLDRYSFIHQIKSGDWVNLFDAVSDVNFEQYDALGFTVDIAANVCEVAVAYFGHGGSPLSNGLAIKTYWRLSQDPAVWGEITGTLGDQADLKAALDNRSLLSHSHDGVYDPAGSAASVAAALTLHRDDVSNPHNVTVTQIGADPVGSAGAVQSNLDNHEADNANPHNVTAAQTGADLAGSADAVQANLDAHETSYNNPHNVAKAQVGLSQADNTADINKPVSGPQQAALDAKENLIGAKGTAFNTNFGQTSGTSAEGNDPRFSDARPPTAHTHEGDEVDIVGGTPGNAVRVAAGGTLEDAGVPPGGATDLSNTPTSITVVVESSTGSNTAIASATQVAAGVMSVTDKTKLDNTDAAGTPRPPAAHEHTGDEVEIPGGVLGNAVAIDANGNLVDAGSPPGGTGQTNLTNTPSLIGVTIESSSGLDTTVDAATASQAGVLTASDKVRLDATDAAGSPRPPSAHNHDGVYDPSGSAATVQGNLDSHTGDATIHFTQASISIPASQISNFDTEVANNTTVAANTSKLAGIEDNATADQTAVEIKTAYESNADTNEFSDAEKLKLSTVEDGATIDQTPAEIKAAYESNANTNAFTDAEQTKVANSLTSTGSIDTHTDVDTTTVAPIIGQVLEWDGGNWIPATSPAGVTDHTLLSNIGTNTHAQIDTHINDGTLHGGGVTDHTLLSNIGVASHDLIDTHIGMTAIHYSQAAIQITASQVTDFDAEVASNTAVAANTAKVSASGSIDTHSDVDTSTAAPATDEALAWDGSDWVPATKWGPGSTVDYWKNKLQRGGAGTYAHTNGLTLRITNTSSGNVNMTTPTLTTGEWMEFQILYLQAASDVPVWQVNGNTLNTAALPTWETGKLYMLSVIVTSGEAVIAGSEALTGVTP